jgi:hypothetical protein
MMPHAQNDDRQSETAPIDPSWDLIVSSGEDAGHEADQSRLLPPTNNPRFRRSSSDIIFTPVTSATPTGSSELPPRLELANVNEAQDSDDDLLSAPRCFSGRPLRPRATGLDSNTRSAQPLQEPENEHATSQVVSTSSSMPMTPLIRTTTLPAKGKRKRDSDIGRQKKKAVRRTGACLRCRLLKETVSPGVFHIHVA